MNNIWIAQWTKSSLLLLFVCVRACVVCSVGVHVGGGQRSMLPGLLVCVWVCFCFWQSSTLFSWTRVSCWTGSPDCRGLDYSSRPSWVCRSIVLLETSCQLQTIFTRWTVLLPLHLPCYADLPERGWDKLLKLDGRLLSPRQVSRWHQYTVSGRGQTYFFGWSPNWSPIIIELWMVLNLWSICSISLGWDDRHVPQCLVYSVWGMEPRVSCMLNKHQLSWSSRPPGSILKL